MLGTKSEITEMNWVKSEEIEFRVGGSTVTINGFDTSQVWNFNMRNFKLVRSGSLELNVVPTEIFILWSSQNIYRESATEGK